MFVAGSSPFYSAKGKLVVQGYELLRGRDYLVTPNRLVQRHVHQFQVNRQILLV